jgi:hypothetical protein
MEVQQLAAVGSLSERADEVRAAAQRADSGDPDWQQWVDELNRDEAVVVDLRVRAELELDGGSIETIEQENHGIWVELAPHPPMLAAAVAKPAAKDFAAIARRAAGLGAELQPDELDRMHVAVELSDELLTTLRAARARTELSRAPATRV